MKKHVRFRHHLTFAFLRSIFRWYLFFRYNFRRRFHYLKRNTPYLILFNHAANIDGYAVACSFRRPIYFVSTEHLMSVMYLSRIVDYLIAPIPIQKNKTDLKSVREILKVVKEGGSIGLSPEGNSSITGENAHLSKSIVKLVKLLKIPLAFCHILGNYMANPRWGKNIRKKRLTCELAHVIEPEAYASLNDDDLYQLIKDKLYVNAYDDQRREPQIYRSKEPALYLERVLFVCPQCRSLDRLHSVGDHIFCKSCTLDMKLDAYGFFTDNPYEFQTVIDWDNWQKPVAASLIGAYPEATPLYEPDRMLVLEHVKTATRFSFKRKLGYAWFTMTKTGLSLVFADKSLIFSFDDIECLAMADKNQLLIYRLEASTIMLKGKDRWGPYKYIVAYQKIVAQRRNVEPEYLGI